MGQIMTVEISDTLHVHVCNSDDPHVLIERIDGGLVRIEPREVRHLSDVLCLAGGDLAALATGNERILISPKCCKCGETILISLAGSMCMAIKMAESAGWFLSENCVLCPKCRRG